MRTIFSSETLKAREQMSVLDADGRIILKWILRKYNVKMYTMCTGFKLAQDSVQWRALVNTVIKTSGDYQLLKKVSATCSLLA
jgi:hypothetical protein